MKNRLNCPLCGKILKEDTINWQWWDCPETVSRKFEKSRNHFSISLRAETQLIYSENMDIFIYPEEIQYKVGTNNYGRIKGLNLIVDSSIFEQLQNAILL